MRRKHGRRVSLQTSKDKLQRAQEERNEIAWPSPFENSETGYLMRAPTLRFSTIRKTFGTAGGTTCARTEAQRRAAQARTGPASTLLIAPACRKSRITCVTHCT